MRQGIPLLLLVPSWFFTGVREVVRGDRVLLVGVLFCRGGRCLYACGVVGL